MDVDAEIQNVLAHHGVKGMRWGVRRAERKAARSERKAARKEKRKQFFAKIEKAYAEGADRRFEENATSFSKKIDLHNRAGDLMDLHGDIERINGKSAYIEAAHHGILLKDDHPVTQKYLKEFTDTYVQRVKEAAAEEHTNYSGNRELHVVRNQNDVFGFTVKTRAIAQHAAEDLAPALSMELRFIKDAQGLITGFELVPDTLEQGALALGEILEHHGIKGMRWGVRRERTQDVTVTTKRKNKAKAKGGQDLPIHKDAVKKVEVAQIKKKSGVNALSDAELKAYANRLQLEANVSRLESEQKSAGSKWIRKFLKDSGNQTENTFVNETSQAVGKSLGKAAVRRGTKVAVKTGVKAALG